jgi:ribosomal protein L37E
VGRVKDDLIAEEEARAWSFEKRARKNDWRCTVCGQLITEEDEPIYYETKMCGQHAYQMEKND